jgi:ABC-type polysaccharide/polyol phosphate export permease
VNAGRPGILLLLGSLAAKELKVRYKRSLLGFAWFLLKPVFNMIVFTIVFTRIIRFGGGIEHYPLFLLTGLLIWNFFSSSLNAATTSLLDNTRLIRSISFPRAVLPAASVAANAIHLLLSLLVTEILLAAFGHPLSASLLALLPALAILMVMTAGIAMALSVWNVYFRDVAQFVEVLLLAWFYASPVIYPLGAGMLPSRAEAVIRLNPVSGILEIVHSAMYYGTWPPAWCWLTSSAWMLVLFAGGLAAFRAAEPAVVKEL